MFQEIKKSQFGICSGGITTYEFAAIGIPFAIICQNRHQTVTAKKWEKVYGAINLGMPNKNTHKKVSIWYTNHIRHWKVECLRWNTLHDVAVDALAAAREY